MNRNDLEGWRGQYKRMLRWQARVQDVYNSREDIETIYDFVYAFFQNCYHLRDWLISDGIAKQHEVDEYVANNIELKLCRDICNSSKHKEISRHSIDPTPMIVREWDPFDRDWRGWFLYSDKKRSISALIAECTEKWKIFLINKGVLSEQIA